MFSSADRGGIQNESEMMAKPRPSEKTIKMVKCKTKLKFIHIGIREKTIREIGAEMRFRGKKLRENVWIRNQFRTPCIPTNRKGLYTRDFSVHSQKRSVSRVKDLALTCLYTIERILV